MSTPFIRCQSWCGLSLVKTFNIGQTVPIRGNAIYALVPLYHPKFYNLLQLLQGVALDSCVLWKETKQRIK